MVGRFDGDAVASAGMAARRPPISSELEAELFAANQRTCCICHEPRKHVQIHHIDGDRTNNEWENLAVLCLDCHSRVTGDEGLGRKYKPEEVTLYKERWEVACEGDDDDGEDEETEGDEDDDDDDEEDEEALYSKAREFIIRASDHQAFPFRLSKGVRFVATVHSDEPVDITVASERVYDRWDDGEEVDPDVSEEDHLEATVEFIPPRTGTFVLWIENNDKKAKATVSLDVTIWPSEDGDDA